MTILEIAALAGVSPSTVSRVFSHHPNIREEVKKKVLAVAQKYEYHPRLTVRQRNVVLITPSVEDPARVQCCVEMLMMALSQELPRRGFRIEVLPQDNLERLSHIQFCAAVSIGCDAHSFPDWPERFTVPLVIVDRDAKHLPQNVYVVRSDEEQGMDMAIDFLFKHDCRKIGCIIHGKSGSGNTQLRYDAICRSLKKRKLLLDESLIHFGEENQYVEITGKLLQKGVDSLFCPGGSGGILGAYALSLFNKRIPEDISLIATEQVFFSRYGTPPQTTLCPDYKLLASSVGDVIEKRIVNSKVPSRTVLPYLLITRESVR